MNFKEVWKVGNPLGRTNKRKVVFGKCSGLLKDKGMQVQKSLVSVWICGENKRGGGKALNFGTCLWISGEEGVGREGGYKKRLFEEAV